MCDLNYVSSALLFLSFFLSLLNRGIVVELAEEMGVQVEVRRVSVEELREADEMFTVVSGASRVDKVTCRWVMGTLHERYILL